MQIPSVISSLYHETWCQWHASEGEESRVEAERQCCSHVGRHQFTHHTNGMISFCTHAPWCPAGMEKGVKGMCVGEKRTIRVPAHLAYGQAGLPGHVPRKWSALGADCAPLHALISHPDKL